MKDSKIGKPVVPPTRMAAAVSVAVEPVAPVAVEPAFREEYYRLYREAIALNMSPEEAAKYAHEKC